MLSASNSSIAKSMSPEALHTLIALCVVSAGASVARAQLRGKPFDPAEGVAGKDVPWVATPPALVEKMLDLARVSADDYVIDLGSGDGRTVVAAAKRGARALGVEFNPRLIEVSERAAAKVDVTDRVSFVQADLFEFDFSAATVLMLFLMPENLRKLTPKFSALAPGSRIVTNRFAIDGWCPDERVRIDGDSENCCTAYLYTVDRARAG
jgi:SAM-dependent methyltransferase